MTEHPVAFPCEGDSLIGIVHAPERAGRVGVVIIVAGGPQYRVGAHRQFVLLARRLAAAGLPVIRFDHRGTGDSEGECRGFLDMNADIAGAIDVLMDRFEGLDSIVLWGECESATAGAFYGHTDPRVRGLFMVNPWVRTEQGQAKTYLKHYYFDRLRDPEFWHKLRAGQFSAVDSVKSFFGLVGKVRSGHAHSAGAADDLVDLPLPTRLMKCIARFQGELLILTSGRDYIAQEFKDSAASSDDWKSIMDARKVTLHDMADADHTFSRLEWRQDLFDTTERWIAEHFG